MYKNKIVLLIIIFLNLSIKLFSNASATISGGSNLYFYKEESIYIKKEILKITYDLNTDYYKIDVYFEFFNPDEERKIKVGFKTDVDDNRNLEHINNFVTIVNDSKINYEIEEIVDERTRTKKNHIFTFEVKFKKGITVIENSYYSKGSVSKGGDIPSSIGYSLTTGANWAKPIEDFTLIIYTNDKIYFADLPFNNIENNNKNYYGITFKNFTTEGTLRFDKERRSAYMKTGSKIIFRENNLLPEKDLNFGTYRGIENYEGLIRNNYADPPIWDLLYTDEELKNMFPYEYELFKRVYIDFGRAFNTDIKYSYESHKDRYSFDVFNLFYNILLATHGYPFKEKLWLECFQDCLFYIKDENYNFKNLSDSEQKQLLLINYLRNEESESKLFKTIVYNLRLREGPITKSKIIRNLNYGEELELLETGNEEIIDEIIGKWIKIKTKNNEIGWCFNAYVECSN